MIARTVLHLCWLSLLLVCSSTAYSAGGQIGLGYGKEFNGNTDIAQIELFYRMPLSYEKKLGDVWNLKSSLEFAGAVIDDNDSDASTTGRLSLMPQLTLSPNDSFHFLIGMGGGVMLGETEFADHNLGGPIFLSSKLGVLLLFGKRFGLEYNFYHQSNAGIYDYNASLNMHYIGISYSF